MTNNKDSYSLSCWIFLRSIGFIYLIAFLSFYVQYKGLIGQQGILPFDYFLQSFKSNFGNNSYFLLPAINWIDSSDRFLFWQLIVSISSSILLIIGILPTVFSILLWVSYLSIVNIGQIFMSYQWDALLLEAGFLCIFISPFKILSRTSNAHSPSLILVFLFRVLLFKLMFSSGIGKLLSGDETWRNFTALDYHYFTQPIPNPISWYIHKFPGWFHKLSVFMMLFIEIVVPLFYFVYRKPRYIAGFLTILLQILIVVTGNFTYFNLLSIVMCIFLYEDSFLGKFINNTNPRNIIVHGYSNRSKGFHNFKQISLIILCFIIMFFSVLQFSIRYLGLRDIPDSVTSFTRYISAFHIINNYGLFTVMTTNRQEIIIQGSNDGRNWQTYEFKYKPDKPGKPLPFIAPHQPRLDWQMWFAALGSHRSNPWIINLLYRIRDGSEDVLGLLQMTPFPDRPPLFLRAVLFEYEFTSPKERKAAGNIWNIKYRGSYLPTYIR